MKKKTRRIDAVIKQHRKALLDCAKVLEGILPVVERATTGNVSHTLANIHFAIETQARYLRRKAKEPQ